MNERSRFSELLRPYIGAVYVFSALLVVLPLLNLLSNLGELQPTIVRWRFGALGLLTGSLLVPLMGLLLFGLTAALLAHRWALRTMAVLSGLATVGVLALMALFTLDALQVRGEVTAAALGRFDLAIVQTIVIQFLLLVMLGVMFRASLKSLRASRSVVESKAAAQPESMLVRAR